jgi:hypothetical protein
VVLVAEAGEALELPRSACGANPLLSVEECATVVVSGCAAAGDFTAELTGVVVTGWLGTALPVAAIAAFAGAVPALTGSLSAGVNDGARPAGPLAARLEKPGENAGAEYGAVALCCPDITW